MDLKYSKLICFKYKIKICNDSFGCRSLVLRNNVETVIKQI